MGQQTEIPSIQYNKSQLKNKLCCKSYIPPVDPYCAYCGLEMETRAKSAQNFDSQRKFYVFKTKIEKYPLKKSQKNQKQSQID